MKKLKFLLVFIFSTISFTISSQNYFNETISNNLLKYTVEEFPEKIYIHTDKKHYSTSETIWFSAYLVNGITLQKSTKSFVTYVEFISPTDSIIDRKTLFINAINTAGNFQLDKKILSGTYKIRAYTNDMRNRDSKYFFEKKIIIWKQESKAENSKDDLSINLKKDAILEKSNFKPNLNFYPQGGYLINDLPNKVAIKVKNILFDELKLQGTIVDQNNEIITSFSTLEFGLAEFILIPKKGDTYFAIIENENDVFKYELPTSLEKGFILNVLNNPQELIIEINSNTINGLLGTSLVIHERGKLIYNENFNEAVPSKMLKLQNEQLSNGVLHLTLFNSNGQPVSERLVFIDNNKKQPRVTIEKPREYFGNRKKVTIKVNVKDEENNTIPSKLSLAVRDLNASPENKYAENIRTWLLLNSDLRGEVYNPNYFFENTEIRKRKFLLDLLMLTNGWRRFSWQEIISKTAIKNKFEVEKGITFSGKTLDLNAPYRIKSVPTRLSFMGNVLSQEPIKKSNEFGDYKYGPFVFYDTIPILIEARRINFEIKNAANREIFIAPNKVSDIAPFFSDDSSYNLQKSQEEIASYLKFQKYLNDLNLKFKQSENILSEVVIKSKLRDKEDLREQEMDDRTSYGGAWNRYDMTDNNFVNGSALNLFIDLPGIRVINDDVIVNRFPNTPPLILLDEIPVDISELSTILASEISFIDILLAGEAVMFSSNGAVISMYSKQGNGNYSTRNIKRKPGIIDYEAVGFYTAKEFYAPDHINGIEEQTKSDVRTTLHWEPTISINEDKGVEISFFTSDADSKYLIEIQGITTTGIPFYKTTEIVVD
jgi:hypothetical protein